MADLVASFIGDSAYDQDDIYRPWRTIAPHAAVIVPPRVTAVPSGTATTQPTRRDRHPQSIAKKGRIGWQKALGYNKRSRVKATSALQASDPMGALTEGPRRKTEIDVAVDVLNGMLEFGCPISIRIA